MESIGFYLKQVLAVVLSGSLLSATVPPPSPGTIGAPPVRLYKRIPGLSARPALTKKIGAQSSTHAIEPKLRSQLESDGMSLVRRGTKAEGSVVSDNKKATTTGRANDLAAKRQFAGKIAAVDAHGLSFIENRGQFDARVKFQVSNHGKTLWLTQSGIVLDFVKTEPNQTRALPSEVELPGENRPGQGSAGNPKVQNPIGQIAARDVIYQNFVGANDNPIIETKRLEEGVRNYLSGDDPKKWRTDVRGFSEIVYHDVWKGVNLRLYGNGPNLEEEFIVAPGADLSQVQIEYEGIERLRVERGGSLLIKTSAGQMRETAPRIYQRVAGRETVVKGRFKLLSPTSYTFQIAKYDARQPLTIDPTLLYSTYLGGSAGNNFTSNGEVATGIAVDAAGNAYVTGYTASPDFPTTPGAFQLISGSISSFVTKLNPTGSALIYSTYLNGTAGQSYSFSNAIAVDQNGNAYVAGYTSSNTTNEFPTTPNAYAPACSSPDFFVTELNATGSGLVYSSCVGANAAGGGTAYGFYPKAVAVDSRGGVYVTGGTTGQVPTTANAYQPSNPGAGSAAFAMVFDTTSLGTSSLIYSTYFGIPGIPPGSLNFGVLGNGIAVDSFGNIYFTGWAGPGLPTTAGAFQATYPGVGACFIAIGFPTPPCPAAFIAKFNPSATGTASLIYSTYVGGPGNTAIQTSGNGIAVDSGGNAYIAGYTGSSNFPVTQGAFQTTVPGLQGAATSAFVTKLNASGSGLIYSSFIDGNTPSSANGIAVDSLGEAYVAGTFRGDVPNASFPVTPDAFQNTVSKNPHGSESFLTKLNASGSAVIYSTYFGGERDDVATALAIDQNGNAYLAGHTSSAGFPITQFAFQPVMRGTGDAFVAKFSLGGATGLSISSIANSRGGNSGSVTDTIVGTGFTPGATVKLVCSGQPDVVGTNVTVAPEGTTLTATFSLQGVAPGTCDVVVTNSNGTAITDAQAFTVQSGGAADVRVQKIATGAVPGRNLNYFVTLENLGNIDANNLLAIETLQPWFTFLSSNRIPSTILQGDAGWPPSVIGTGIQSDAILQWSVPTLPANGIQSFTYCVRLDNSFPVGLTVEGPACVTTNVNGAAACTAALASCEGAADLLCQLLEPNVPAVAGCIIAASLVCERSFHQCLDSPPTSVTVCAPFPTPVVGSLDPNYQVGPTGVGSPRWVSDIEPLPYVVHFENQPSATASAQQVVVTNPLDPNMDLSSVQLGGVTIASKSAQFPSALNPNAGRNEVMTNLDLRPTQNLVVNVDFKLDLGSRLLTWTFNSIDPATGLPPTDATIGFLPPGGEASVFFTTTPKQGLATNTLIQNQARVVFDANPPINTPTWTNMLDNTPPTSQVAALPATEFSATFAVNWTGTDVGAGVQDFTIFVSDNGRPFTAFQTNTTATSATFAGQTGHSYAFYSIARDLVGNVEGAKTVAEATTLVSVDTTPPTTTAVLSPQPNGAGWNNTNVAVMLASTDNPGGSGVKQITYSATGAQTIANTLVSGSSTTFTITSEGVTTVTFFGTDNAGNIETAKTITIQLDKTPPTISGSRTPPPNANGWNNANVTVSFQCADSLSGLAAGSPPSPTTLSSEGAGQSVTGTCTDVVGNSASATVNGINIDKTPPVITASANPSTLWPPNGKMVNVTVSGTMTDNLSGVNPSTATFAVTDSYGLVQPSGNVTVSANGSYSFTILLEARREGQDTTGRHYTIMVTAQDNAGNQSSAATTVVVPHDQGQ